VPGVPAGASRGGCSRGLPPFLWQEAACGCRAPLLLRGDMNRHCAQAR